MSTIYKLFSYEEFKQNIEEMKNLSDKLMDGWIVRSEKDLEAGIFAIKKIRKIWKQTDGREDTVTFEYHISFNASYSVPVICFITYKNDGSQLSPEQSWEILNLETPYTMLTQMDHPILQIPFLTVHPCKTTQFINESFKRSKNVLISWLSAIGPFVGLALPPEYFKLTY